MKRFIIVIWSITCLSCTDFLNLKPDNKQVVYTLEDVKVSMSTYLWALCSPNQITLFEAAVCRVLYVWRRYPDDKGS